VELQELLKSELRLEFIKELFDAQKEKTIKVENFEVYYK